MAHADNSSHLTKTLMCKNNCGYFGNSIQYDGYCSICYRKLKSRSAKPSKHLEPNDPTGHSLLATSQSFNYHFSLDERRYKIFHLTVRIESINHLINLFVVVVVVVTNNRHVPPSQASRPGTTTPIWTNSTKKSRAVRARTRSSSSCAGPVPSRSWTQWAR